MTTQLKKSFQAVARNSYSHTNRMVAVLNTVLRNLEVDEGDISRILTTVYNNVSRNNLEHVFSGTNRVCPHGYSLPTCEICRDNNNPKNYKWLEDNYIEGVSAPTSDQPKTPDSLSKSQNQQRE